MPITSSFAKSEEEGEELLLLSDSSWGLGRGCSWAGKAICSWWSAKGSLCRRPLSWLSIMVLIALCISISIRCFSRLGIRPNRTAIAEKDIQYLHVKEDPFIPKSNTELADSYSFWSHKNAHLSLAKNHSKLAGYVLRYHRKQEWGEKIFTFLSK